jgi:hypothetical protein
MVRYLPLFFLQGKINDLQTALFYNLSGSVFKTPTSVIYSLKTDDCGQIWFCMPVNGSINELDKEFPSLLQFFKKGKHFHVKINGRAFIVNDPEEVNAISWADDKMKNDAIAGKMMLLKVKIQYADYFEQKHKQAKNELVSILKNVYGSVFENAQSKYSFLHNFTAKSGSFPGRIQYH